MNPFVKEREHSEAMNDIAEGGLFPGAQMAIDLRMVRFRGRFRQRNFILKREKERNNTVLLDQFVLRTGGKGRKTESQELLRR